MSPGNLNDTPSQMPRSCRPSTLFVSHNNHVGHKKNLLSLGIAEITVGYDCIVDSPIAPAMKLDVSAVHMDSTLIWTLFASVNHWLLVSTSNKRERRDVPEGCNATPWKSC